MKRHLLIFVQLFSFLYVTAQRPAVVDHRNDNAVDLNATLVRPAFENMPVYRIQLRLTTGKGNNTGTDDDVYVQMNGGDNRFFLVKGIDNFQENKTVTYDVLSTNITSIKDIEFMQFGIRGTDGLCLKKIDLLINNCASPLFSRTYATDKGACIDNNASNQSPTLKIEGAQLRSSGLWNYEGARANLWRPPLMISKEWITSLVEAAVGDQMNQGEDQELKWGTAGNAVENKTIWGPAVEITKVKDKHTLSFDLDLERIVTGPNPEVDVDFDMDFRCEEGKILFETKNVKISTDLVGDIQNYVREKGIKLVGKAIGGWVAGPGGAAIGGTVGGFIGKVLAIGMHLDPKAPNSSVTCVKILVNDGGDILLR